MGVLRALSSALSGIVDFLAPDVCHLCGNRHDERLQRYFPPGPFSRALLTPVTQGLAGVSLQSHPVCACCACAFRESREPGYVAGVAVHAPFLTNEVLLRMIHTIKFARYRHLVTGAAGASAAVLASVVTGKELLVPVPMDQRSRRRRGFNQSEDMAMEVGRRLGLEVAPAALKKVLRTRRQSLTPHADRSQNVVNAFAVGDAAIAGRSVLIVDDLVTTGATAVACALAARGGGAVGVAVVCLGRSRRTGPGRGVGKRFFRSLDMDLPPGYHST